VQDCNPFAMDQSTRLAHRFGWADTLLNCACQFLHPAAIESSLLFTGGGTDSEFTGGAAGWECACDFIKAATVARGWPQAALDPQSICDPRLDLSQNYAK